MTLVDLWPVLGVRVVTPALEMFVPSAEALVAVAALAAKGIYDPQNQYLPRTPVCGWEDVESPEGERRFLRHYWAALADWRPERWNLLLAARAGDRIVGVQEVGAQDFGLTRTVSTGSWIGREYQGAGYGKAMRGAVLQLAFAGLGAERADSAAWRGNEASLGVSRALGYRANGTTTRAAEGRRVEQVNLTLSREDWGPSEGAVVEGLTPEALSMFGAEPRRTAGQHG